MLRRSSCLQNIVNEAFLPKNRYDHVVSNVAEHRDGAVPDGSCGIALADDLGWGLGTVFRTYVTAAQAAVADLPGGPRGYQALSAAAHGTVGSQLALAQHLGVDRTVMTYLLDDLESAGLIERRPDPADRRARRIVATKQGTKLLAALNDRLQTAEAHLLTPLDPKARESFRAQLRVLATHIDAVDPLESPCDLADAVDAELPVPRRTAREARSR
ncbi:MAG: MarR family transcriptional regulator [Frankiales bacterium]|nr:MarR family transcriptional regulator [Frankiales bacterium]MCW2706178.1 MarR family transcriptional regulator [Frankiales bacterium]